MKRKINIYLCTLLIFTLTFCLIGCSNDKEDSEAVPTLIKPTKESYTLVAVKKGSIEEKLSFHGTLVPKSQGEVYFNKRGGRVSNVYVSLGDSVKKGQLLAALDTEELDEELREAELNLKIAELTFDEASSKGGDSFEIKKADLELQDAKSKVNSTQTEIEKCKLYSPFDGIVVYKAEIGKGQNVEALKTIFRIAPTAEKEIDVNDGKFEAIKPDQKAIIKYNNKAVEGKVRLCPVNMPADLAQDKRNFLRITGNNNFNDANFGDVVNVDVVFQKKDNILVISKALVHSYNDKVYVNLYSNKKRTQKFITTGIENNDEVEVLSGLNEGDQIIK